MERFFVSRPIFAICIALAIVLLGAISIFDLSIEQYPDITPPVVEVTASYSGADAETVNDAVATPVAQSVMGVSDMLYMQSTSANDGSMVLQVVFDVGTDPDLDAIFTQNNVATSTALLPSSVVTQGVVTQKTMTGFLMVFALHSDGRYDNEFLSNYAYINLQNQLLKINGVGKVSIMGAGEYAMRIWVKPDLLNYYNVSLDELRSAVLAEGGIYPAGQFGAEPSPEGTTYTYTVTMPRQISTAEEFAAIVVKTTPAGEQIFLRDVADVALGSKSYGVASAFGEEPATLLVIYQEPGSNAVDVGNRVKAAIGRLSERFPDGVSCTTIVDSTESIRSGVKEIILTLILALVLVIAIIYLFIQDWRATLIPLVAIPVSLIGTFIFFPLLGFSINIISLLGLVLAIGLVVDDAIVVVEAAQVNIERGMKSREAAIEAMRNVASPIVATTVVLLAVFIPMSFVGGISGRLFQQFAVTISVSVVLSAFNALTLSPALCALLLKPRKEAAKGFFAAFNRRFDRWLEGYSSRIAATVRHMARTAVLLLAIGCVIGAAWYFMPGGFLPEEDQGYVMVVVNAPEASSLRVTQEALVGADRIIRSLPEVQYTSYAAGFNMLAGIAETDSGVVFVKLVDYSDRKRSAMQIAAALNVMLYEGLPEAEGFAFIPPSIPGLGVTSGLSAVTQDLEGLLREKHEVFYRKELNEKLQKDRIDITLNGKFIPQGKVHPLTSTTNEIVTIFQNLGFSVVSPELSPEVETEYYNFDMLNVPKDHPARDVQDTFYVKDMSGVVLRSQTSGAQIHVMENQKPPIKVISPGRVYRNENINARKNNFFHQIEGLYVDKDITFGDLKGVLNEFIRLYFGASRPTRFRSSFFPFTEPSAEVDVQCIMCQGKGCKICSGTGWLEVLGCGMVDVNVLRGVGIDPDVYSGFAFGMGVERLAMLKYAIDDIRLFFNNDKRFLEQF